MKYLIAAMLLFIASEARAELNLALPTETGRKVADIASWGTTLTDIGLDTAHSFNCPNKLKCFEKQGLRNAINFGETFLAKTLVKRDRPCAPDCGIDKPNTSFFSGHTSFSFTAAGSNKKITIPLAIGTMFLRPMAGKHWLSDTLVGAGVGYLNSLIK